MKAKTMLFHVVQSASLSRFYRKHYLPSNLLENRKSWNPSVNSATVIFGAKMAVKDENLMFASLQTLRTHCLHFQYDVSNVPSHTEHVKRSLETSKIEKKAKICWFSGFAAITKSKNRKVSFSPRGLNIFQNPFKSIFVNLNANFGGTPGVSRGPGKEKLWFLCFFGSYRAQKTVIGAKIQYIFKGNQYFSKPFQQHFSQLKCKKKKKKWTAKPNVDLVRRNFDFCVFFLGHNAVQRCSGATIQKKNTKQDLEKKRRGVRR